MYNYGGPPVGYGGPAAVYGGPAAVYGPPDVSATTAQFVSTGEPSLPTRKVVTPTASPVYFNSGCFRCFGALLALLAATTFALGIADVVLTMQNYCNPTGANGCSTSAEPYIWVWVASGIWASVPIFLAGLFAMCIGRNPVAWTRIFALLCFLSAFVFAPALIVLSAVEAWRGWAAPTTFYSFSNGGLAPGTIAPATNPYQAKFGIPVAIAVLGGIMFLMTGFVTLCLCCCMQCLGIYMPEEISTIQASAAPVAPAPTPQLAASTVVNKQVYYPPRPQVANPSYTAQNFNDDYPADPYSRFSAMPYPAVRYNSVANPFGSGAMFGNNFPFRTGGSFARQFMAPNPSSFWN
jgi:hypothetical protein